MKSFPCRHLHETCQVSFFLLVPVGYCSTCHHAWYWRKFLTGFFLICDFTEVDISSFSSPFFPICFFAIYISFLLYSPSPLFGFFKSLNPVHRMRDLNQSFCYKLQKESNIWISTTKMGMLGSLHSPGS